MGEIENPVKDGSDDTVGETLSASPQLSIAARLSRYTARNPRKVLLGSLFSVIFLSAIGVIVGEFKIEVDNKGWLSRKTQIADRQMQMDIVNYNRGDLFTDTDGSVWEKLKTKNSEGFIEIEQKEESYQRKLQNFNSDRKGSMINPISSVKNEIRATLDSKMNRQKGQSTNIINFTRNLESVACDATWYENSLEVLDTDNLFAVWKAEPKKESATKSILDPEVLMEICKAEVKTLEALEDSDMCEKCYNGDSCLPPSSLITVLRLKFDMMNESCDTLMSEYAPLQETFTDELLSCTQKYTEVFDKASLLPGDTGDLCPAGYSPGQVDVMFGANGNKMLRYTTSYFATIHTQVGSQESFDFYDVYPNMNGADGDIVEGVYDTTQESLSTVKIDKLVQSDMALAVASLTITFIAMMVHTRSPWLTMLGIFQIVFAIPLAYFVYVFVARLTFFPFLNFIGVFVSAALGADDLFVAVDKFKNARIANPKRSTEDIAEIALPDAASAMLLTTSTTAVAFFATCICPVPPILCFAVYCGLMIVFNYVLNILFVFPGLCLYDLWILSGKKNYCVTLCGKKEREDDDDEYHEDELEKDPEATKDSGESTEQERVSLIHRILGGHYGFIHRFRWFVLAASIGATAFCVWYSTQLAQPETTEVRLLPASDPFESHFVWKNYLLSSILFSSGAAVEIAFGVKPGDTGPQNNPDILSKLLLDETFNPRTQEAQLYLKEICDRFFDNDFVVPAYTGYKCPMNEFDDWLSEQSTSSDKTVEYSTNCGSSSSLPLPEDTFDDCIISWSQLVENRNILQENGVVKIMTFEVETVIDFTAPIPAIKDEWQKYENFFNSEEGPVGVDKPIHVSFMWWWLDTNDQMFRTALGAAAIAIGFSAIIVLISSRSLVLTLFSEVCILYVLSAATATLVGFGWELGFLESVCFAILVGISCDFIIHFGHAYIHHEGSVDREVRTKFAVIHMGPSILAAALTTFAAAVVMLFCEVIFFTKFAMILLVTIFHATIGSFVVYIVLNDLFGPSEPTKLVDSLVAKITGKAK